MDQYQATCTSCAFWEQSGEDSPIGKCRRHAPKPVSYDLDMGTEGAWWPHTEETEWCGEHKPAVRASTP